MTTADTTNQDTLLVVKSIVEDMLQERFSPDDITFTEIKVETRTSYYGDDYIDIRIFYTGNHDVPGLQVDSDHAAPHHGRNGKQRTRHRQYSAHIIHQPGGVGRDKGLELLG